MNLILVRHGQDTDNESGVLNGHRDTDLTDLGKQQAGEVAGKLLDDRVDLILHFSLKRATQTAQIIADKLGLDEVFPNPLLIERDFGVMTGKLIKDIPKLTDKLLLTDKITYFLDVERAESFPVLLERGRQFLKWVQENHPNKTIVVVTHGDIGKMIQAAYHGWDWEDTLKGPYFANTGVLHLGTKDIVE